MSMFSAVVSSVGFMTMIFLRMRRIYRVQVLYNAYLIDQMNDVDDKDEWKTRSSF